MGDAAGVEPPAARLVTPAFLLVTGAMLSSSLAFASLLPVLPRFAEGPLGAGGVGVGLAVGAASLTALLAQPPAGRLGDLRGRKLLIVGGPLLLAAATLAYVPVASLAPLVLLRLVAGIGEALVFVGAATAIADLAPDDRRGEAMSYYSLALYGGLAVGPVVGELALDGSHYDRVWVIAAGFAVLGSLAGLLVPETRPPGAAGAHEPGALVHRRALLPGFVLLSALVGFGGFTAFVALYALELGLDAAGPVFVEFSAIVVTVRLLGARIPDRLGPLRAAAGSLTLLVAGYAVMAAAAAPWMLYAGVAVFALGQSLAFPALVTLAVSRAPAHERSSVIGTFSAFVDVAIVVGAVGLGGIVSLGGYRAAFAAAAVAAGFGFVLLARLQRT